MLSGRLRRSEHYPRLEKRIEVRNLTEVNKLSMMYTTRVEKRNESRLRRGTRFFTESRNRGNGDRGQALTTKRPQTRYTVGKTCKNHDLAERQPLLGWVGFIHTYITHAVSTEFNLRGCCCRAQVYINYIYFGEFSETMWRRVVEGLLCRRRLQRWRPGWRRQTTRCVGPPGARHVPVDIYIYRGVCTRRKGTREEKKESKWKKKKLSVWHSQVIRTPRGPPAHYPVTHRWLFYTHIIQGVPGQAYDIHSTRRHKPTRRTQFRETRCECATSGYNNSVDRARVPNERVFSEPFWRNVRRRIAVVSDRVWNIRHTHGFNEKNTTYNTEQQCAI